MRISKFKNGITGVPKRATHAALTTHFKPKLVSLLQMLRTKPLVREFVLNYPGTGILDVDDAIDFVEASAHFDCEADAVKCRRKNIISLAVH